MSVTTNAADFADRLRKIAERAEERAVDGVKLVALTTLSEVADGTPVDTGRAQGNWHLTVNLESFEMLGIGGGAASEASLGALQSGDKVFVQNNLPYIRRLNFGHSKKLPAGFVERAIRAGQQVARQIKLVDGGGA